MHMQHPCLRKSVTGRHWVAQSVKRPTWAQVMISVFVSWSPALSSLLSAPGPAWDSLSFPLSLPLLLSLSKYINKPKKKKIPSMKGSSV